MTSISSITDWGTMFGTGLFSGVQPGQLNGLAPSLDATGRNAVIGTGAALLQGFFFKTDASVPTAIPAASTQDRVDRLVLRLNRAASTGSTFIVPTVITGTPGASPQEPALTQTATGLWDLPVCSWTSASSGGLNGLVDERYSGAPVLSGVSVARPLMAGPGLLVETDTGNVACWTGSVWTYVSQVPDSWHTITSFAKGWSGTLSYTQISPGLVAITAALSLGNGADVADAGTTICTLSTKYAPATYKRIPMYTDALKVSPDSGSGSFESASLSIRTDGTVVCYGIGTAATQVAGSATYPLGI